MVPVPKDIRDFFKRTKIDSVETLDKTSKLKKTVVVSDKMTRPDITLLIYYYADRENLKMEDDKRIIIPDKELKRLFGPALGPNENLTFANFQTKLKYLYDKAKSKSAVVSKEV